MLRGVHDDLLSGIVVMFFGDLIGTLLVLYTMKIVLATLRIARGRI
jgi:hypothetical protein